MANATPPNPKQKQRGFSPGCLMFMLFLVWFLGLGGYMLFKLRQQVQDMRSFMDNSASPVGAEQPSAEVIVALRTRMAAFAADVKAGRPATLGLSPDDLNVLMASEDKLLPFRDVIRFESAGVNLTARVSEMHNGMPLTGEHLYMNGRMDFSLKKSAKIGIDMQVVSIRPDNGKSVSEGYFREYSRANYFDTQLLNPFRERTDVAEILRLLTTVRLGGGKVILEFLPASATPPAAAPAAPAVQPESPAAAPAGSP